MTKNRESTTAFLTEHTSVTPDVQLILNPSLAPDRGSVWVFGLRLRTVF